MRFGIRILIFLRKFNVSDQDGYIDIVFMYAFTGSFRRQPLHWFLLLIVCCFASILFCSKRLFPKIKNRNIFYWKRFSFSFCFFCFFYLLLIQMFTTEPFISNVFPMLRRDSGNRPVVSVTANQTTKQEMRYRNLTTSFNSFIFFYFFFLIGRRVSDRQRMERIDCSIATLKLEAIAVSVG